jgi:hypothetical protein
LHGLFPFYSLFGIVFSLYLTENISSNYLYFSLKKGANASYISSIVVEYEVNYTPESVVIEESTHIVTLGDQIQLSASVLPSEASQTITWSSQNSTVASVGTTGLVTANSVGETNIVATAVNGVNSDFAVQVIGHLPATEIQITTPSPLILIIGEEFDIQFTSDSDAYLYWTPTQGDENPVAWVGSTSIVHAVGEGRVLVTATSPSNGELTDTIEVIVRPNVLTSIKLVSDSAVIEIPKSQTTLVSTSVSGTNSTTIREYTSSDLGLTNIFKIYGYKNSASNNPGFFTSNEPIRLYNTSGSSAANPDGSELEFELTTGIINSVHVEFYASAQPLPIYLQVRIGGHDSISETSLTSGNATIQNSKFSLKNTLPTGTSNKVFLISSITINYTIEAEGAVILPSTGIRFRGEYTLPESLDGSEVEAGVLLYPTATLGESVLDKNFGAALDVPAANRVWNSGTHKLSFAAVLTNIPQSQWGTLVTAVTYYYDGVRYVYSAEKSQSLKNIAQLTYDAGGLTSLEADALLAIING